MHCVAVSITVASKPYFLRLLLSWQIRGSQPNLINVDESGEILMIFPRAFGERWWIVRGSGEA